MVSPYRPWQDTRGQEQGEWNGYGQLLYPMAEGLPGRYQKWFEIVKKQDYEGFGSRLVQNDS